MGSPNQERSPRAATAYDKAWATAVNELASLKLSGFTISCPQCGQEGIVVSKWEQSVPTKPLYVAHKNCQTPIHACALTKAEAEWARASICLRRADLKSLLVGRKAYVLFSGGRDSLCTLVFVQRLVEEVHMELVAVHADTTAGFPEVEAYVQEVCSLLRIQLVVVRPTRDYFELAERWGVPGVKSRWCCKTLKIRPIKKFLSNASGSKVVFDGIRAAESPVRASYIPIWFHPSFRCFSVSPLFYWSDAELETYLKELNLPRSPAGDLGTSAECWCGAYKKRRDFEALLAKHPDIFEKLARVEEASKTGFTFVYEKGQQIPLTQIARMKECREQRCVKCNTAQPED